MRYIDSTTGVVVDVPEGHPAVAGPEWAPCQSVPDSSDGGDIDEGAPGSSPSASGRRKTTKGARR